MISTLSRRALALRTTVALAALIPAGTAFAAEAAEAAADDADSGETIVVTARHRDEKSQDVPIAISVVSAETLEKTGNYTLNQIQQQVPSLQVTAFNPRNTNINIRGLGANSSLAVDGLEYGVGFYVDGVYYARPGQSQFDLVDLQQIEVLRGPQGTLFGKNTTAGALNITTREPSFDPELTVEGNVGDHKFHQIRATGSVPIIADKVALRLSIADSHRGGFLTNAYDGSDAQNYDNFSVRGQLLIKPTEDIKIRLIGDYSKQKQHFSLSLIDGYFTTFANGATIANNIFDRAARAGYTLPAPNAFLRVGNADSPFQANMEGYGVSGQVDWDLGATTLTSITAYRWWDWYPKNDVDGTSLPINLKGQQQNFQRQFSQELRIASNGRHFIDYQAGLYYFWQKVPGYGASQFGSAAASWNLPSATPAATVALYNLALSGYEADSYSNATTKSVSGFGQVDAHLTDALTLTAGLRYTHEYKTGEFRRFGIASTSQNLSGLTSAQLAQVQTIRAQFQLSDFTFAIPNTKSNALTGLLTLGYKVTPDVLIYGTYSRGNKSGGLNITAGGASRPVVDPEKVDAFELGLKSQFLDGKVTFNAAAFLTDIRDYQTNVSEPAVLGSTATIQYITNIPKVRSRGIEADLAIAPASWINFTGSAAYTDAKFVSFTNSPQKPELGIPGTLQQQDLSGQRLPGVSKFAYSVAVNVTQPINDDIEVYGRGDWVHRSTFNASPVLSAYSVIAGYGLLNGRLGARTADGQIDISIWARNLLDKKYYLNRTAGTFGVINALPGDPRTAGATLRVKW